MHPYLTQAEADTALANAEFAAGSLTQDEFLTRLDAIAPVDALGNRWFVDGQVWAVRDRAGNWYRDLVAESFVPAPELSTYAPHSDGPAPDPVVETPAAPEPWARPLPSAPVDYDPVDYDPVDGSGMPASTGELLTRPWSLPWVVFEYESVLREGPARIVAMVVGVLSTLAALAQVVAVVFLLFAASAVGVEVPVLWKAGGLLASLVLLAPPVLLVWFAARRQVRAAGLLLVVPTVLSLLSTLVSAWMSLKDLSPVSLIVSFLVVVVLGWTTLSLILPGASRPRPVLVAASVALIQALAWALLLVGLMSVNAGSIVSSAGSGSSDLPSSSSGTQTAPAPEVLDPASEVSSKVKGRGLVEVPASADFPAVRLTMPGAYRASFAGWTARPAALVTSTGSRYPKFTVEVSFLPRSTDSAINDAFAVAGEAQQSLTGQPGFRELTHTETNAGGSMTGYEYVYQWTGEDGVDMYGALLALPFDDFVVLVETSSKNPDAYETASRDVLYSVDLG